VGGASDVSVTVIVILCAFNYFAGDVLCRPDSAPYTENASISKMGRTSDSSRITIPSPSHFISPELINLPEYIHTSLQNYCDACTPSQRKKLEQVLLHILTNLSEESPTSQQYSEALLKTLSKMSWKKFKATSSPKSAKLVNIPTPEYQYYSRRRNNGDEQRVIALPTISTTPSSSSLPSSTVSSAPDPVQSVEMPTPPMAPTTTLPIYFYYLSSSSQRTPTTPVVESSVGSRQTTVMP